MGYETSKQSFSKLLKSEHVKHTLGTLCEKIRTHDSADIVSELTSKVTNLAESCHVKKKIRSHTNRRNKHAPWFDEECQKLKNEILKLGQKLKNSNCEARTREKLFLEKRKLKK